jgi:hypothetical protein
MNKKFNTILFMLGATLFNILVTVICFAALIVLYAKSIAPVIPESGQAWGFPLIFLASIVISFFAYRFVLKLFMTKVEMEKYFDPILKGRK